MSLSLRSFATTVSTAVATAQASCTQLVDMSVGSPGRALMEAVSGTGLWLQYLVLQTLLRTRLSTSTGVDCDSFVNDFGMTRLQGSPASGFVTMSSLSPDGQSAVIPPGAVVRTVSGVSFSVVEDASLSYWSATDDGYVRLSGTKSISVPVSANVSGSTGNVASGAICLMGTSISGIDTVTNENVFSNGSDQESDAQLRARFPLWLAAKATASSAAIGSAISGVQSNLSQSLRNGQAADGSTRSGYFTAVINDGSGAPSASLLSEVYSAIDSVRALGVGFCVQAPSVLVMNVSMTVTVPAATDIDAAALSIQRAISSDIEAATVGGGYAYSRLSYLAYVGAGVSVVSVLDVLLNGGQADIEANGSRALVPGTISIQVVYN